MGRKNEVEEYPANGEWFYWVRSDTGDICQSRWYDGSRCCQFRKSIGNVFKTANEAEFAIAKQQARAENIDRARR